MLSKPIYAGKVALRHAIEVAKAVGLDVGGFELSPDGTIRILEARSVPKPAASLFDRLDAAGQL